MRRPARPIPGCPRNCERRASAPRSHWETGKAGRERQPASQETCRRQRRSSADRGVSAGGDPCWRRVESAAPKNGFPPLESESTQISRALPIRSRGASPRGRTRLPFGSRRPGATPDPESGVAPTLRSQRRGIIMHLLPVRPARRPLNPAKRLAASLGACTAVLLAAPAAAEVALLPETVVTATRIARTADETLAPVSVLTRDDIERLQARSLPDLLRGLPGVAFTNSGGRGQQTSLFLRGAESDHVLVLVDGMRVGSATTGLFELQHLPIALIERIEVVRGPRASLYGSDAIGGVVQIFTRRGRWRAARLRDPRRRQPGHPRRHRGSLRRRRSGLVQPHRQLRPRGRDQHPRPPRGLGARPRRIPQPRRVVAGRIPLRERRRGRRPGAA